MVSSFSQIELNLRRGYYSQIGSGSSRKVFDLKNGYVIKVAKNRAGIAQNKSEYNISQYDNSGLFAKVIEVSNNFKFLIMEKADKIYYMSEVLEYFKVRSKRQLLKSKELQDIKTKYNLLFGDLQRKSSWGMINGRLVIIDYGFTREVHDRYY